MRLRRFIEAVRKKESPLSLYHGTCADSAREFITRGWMPRGSGGMTANMGQGRYLYLTTGIENAEWFAEQRGCTTVLAVQVPRSELIVDPEDGIGETVEDELNIAKKNGFPANLAAIKPIPATAFKIVKR